MPKEGILPWQGRKYGVRDWAVERDEHGNKASNCISSKLGAQRGKVWGKRKQVYKSQSFIYSLKFLQSRSYNGNGSLKRQRRY